MSIKMLKAKYKINQDGFVNDVKAQFVKEITDALYANDCNTEDSKRLIKSIEFELNKDYLCEKLKQHSKVERIKTNGE